MAPEQRAVGTSIRAGVRRDLLLIGLLFAAVLAAYFPALNGGRLLDDDLHITRPELQSLGGLARIWFDVGATQQYYPVLHTAFWVEHRLWGDAVAGYHLLNVLLHAGAAVLVVALMRRLRLPGGWLAAFLFALHPVAVESVAWIAEQKNTLSTVFALGAAISYLDFDERRDRASYRLALGLFALALLSKSAVATVPAALLVVVWWRRSRLGWRRDFRPLLPWFALAGAVGLVTFSVEGKLLAGVDAAFPLSLVGRVLLAGRAFWFYLGKLFWPAGLTFFYPRWTVDPRAGWQYLYPLAAAALAAGLWILARRMRGPLAAFLCFAGILAPVLGFFNVEWFVFTYVADHLQYLASLGVIIPLAAVLAAGAARLPGAARRLAPAAATALAVVLGVLTWRQCGRYADPVTFYRTAAALNPASAAAHDNLGRVLLALPGRKPEAIAEFEAALRISPEAPQGNEDLGAALLSDPERRADAAAHLETALRFRPDSTITRDQLAFALSRLPGRLPDAIEQYRASLRIDPSDPKVHNDLGLALAQTGRLDDAMAQFAEAVRLKPDFAEAHNNLGLAWTLVPGRMADAIAEFQQALRLQPDFAPGWHSLGLAQFRSENLPAAAAAFRQELRLQPDNPAAQQALAAVLRQTGGSN